MAELNSIIYMCARALNYFLSFVHCLAASTVIPLSIKATFTSSIQPNLGVPRTRPPHISAINTLLATLCSSILSMCQNHLNACWSVLLANSLLIPALLRTSYEPLYPFVTLQKNFTNTSSQEHSLSFSQHFSYLLSQRFSYLFSQHFSYLFSQRFSYLFSQHFSYLLKMPVGGFRA